MADDVEILSRARVGSVVDDKWTLERLLGIGGMAAVYGARHRNGARAAVKVLHPHLSRHEDVRERFLREGYAANRVEHPGAVKVLDDDLISSGPDAGTAYLVMELLDGVSLQERLERGAPVSEVEFLRIAASVLDVLQAAHAHGVVHRDLKPENLFLVRRSKNDDPAAGPPGPVKVLDFGLARLLQGKAITTYGLALGTPSFMSPEQATGSSDQVDGRTDLFALAATGFRVRTGRRVHEAPNAIELVRKMGTMAAPPIRTVAADVSEPFARVIDRALEFRREDRYPSAEAMREDLERAIGEIDAGAGPTLIALPASVSKVPVAPSDREPPTIVLTRKDLEPSSSATAAPPGGRRRRRALPHWGFFAFLVVAAIATKVALRVRAGASPFPLAAAPHLSVEEGARSWAPSIAEDVGSALPRDPSVEDDAGRRKGASEDAGAAAVVAKPLRSSAPPKGGPAVVRKVRIKHHPGSR